MQVTKPRAMVQLARDGWMVGWQEDGRALLAQARRVAKGLDVADCDPILRFDYCRQLLVNCSTEPNLSALSATLSGLSIYERHYWVGVFYTLLLSAQRRRDHAAYFTPPYLATAVLDLASEAGFDLASHNALDPAAGGAAFLSTIAARMASASATMRIRSANCG